MPRKKLVEVAEEILGAICEKCYPSGWDSVPEDVQSTGCAHGVWTPDVDPTVGAASGVVAADSSAGTVDAAAPAA